MNIVICCIGGGAAREDGRTRGCCRSAAEGVAANGRGCARHSAEIRIDSSRALAESVRDHCDVHRSAGLAGPVLRPAEGGNRRHQSITSIDNEFYFKRGGLYGYGDDAERFVFFCLCGPGIAVSYRIFSRISFIAMTGKRDLFRFC